MHVQLRANHRRRMKLCVVSVSQLWDAVDAGLHTSPIRCANCRMSL